MATRIIYLAGLLSTVNSILSGGPQNTIAPSGTNQAGILTCAPPSPPVYPSSGFSWNFTSAGSDPMVTTAVATGCSSVSDTYLTYNLSSSNTCDLVVRTDDSSVAGLYQCEVDGQTASARLIVLSCQTFMDATNATIQYGSDVSMTCQCVFLGADDTPLQVTWSAYGAADPFINIHNYTTHETYYESTLTVQALTQGSAYYCTATLGSPGTLQPDQETNVPQYDVSYFYIPTIVYDNSETTESSTSSTSVQPPPTAAVQITVTSNNLTCTTSTKAKSSAFCWSYTPDTGSSNTQTVARRCTCTSVSGNYQAFAIKSGCVLEILAPYKSPQASGKYTCTVNGHSASIELLFTECYGSKNVSDKGPIISGQWIGVSVGCTLSSKSVDMRLLQPSIRWSYYSNLGTRTEPRSYVNSTYFYSTVSGLALSKSEHDVYYSDLEFQTNLTLPNGNRVIVFDPEINVGIPFPFNIVDLPPLPSTTTTTTTTTATTIPAGPNRFTEAPNNSLIMIGQLGNSVIFCSTLKSADSSFDWLFTPVLKSASVTVVSGCQSGNSTSYTGLGFEPYTCNLAINPPVTQSVAGVYTCSSDGLAASALLTTIDCSTNSNITEGTVQAGTVLFMTCNCTFTSLGVFQPVITWSPADPNSRVNYYNVTTNSQSVLVSSTLLVTASGTTSDYYECTATLGNTNTSAPPGHASNLPTYTASAFFLPSVTSL